MSELCLVRHAAFDDTSDARDADGRWDPDLDETGRLQADALAQRLAAHTWTRLVSSPLRRARATAAALADACGMPVEVDARLVEFHRGRLEVAPDPDHPAYRAAWQDGAWEAWPDGETREAFRARVSAALADLRAEEGRVLVVTHGGVVNELLLLVLGCAPSSPFRSDLTGLTRLALGPGGATIAAFNDVWHLEDALALPLRPPAGATS